MSDAPTIDEKIDILNDVMRALNQIYDSPGQAVVWLTSHQALLGAVPLEFIDEGKSAEVLELLEEICEGVYL